VINDDGKRMVKFWSPVYCLVSFAYRKAECLTIKNTDVVFEEKVINYKCLNIEC